MSENVPSPLEQLAEPQQFVSNSYPQKNNVDALVNDFDLLSTSDSTEKAVLIEAEKGDHVEDELFTNGTLCNGNEMPSCRPRSMSESCPTAVKKGILKRRLFCSLSECEPADISLSKESVQLKSCSSLESNDLSNTKKTVRFSEEIERNVYRPYRRIVSNRRKNRKKRKRQTSLPNPSNETALTEDLDTLSKSSEDLSSFNSEVFASVVSKCPTIEEQSENPFVETPTAKPERKSRFRVVRISELVDEGICMDKSLEDNSKRLSSDDSGVASIPSDSLREEEWISSCS
ncbi:hypothetical protein M514_01834 [Trichuris suis]|uniref:Uncharacterized protein n=1 Tax=Trichuris suis TaxID=68888 RepID=A0A085NTB3_9BILA|nr:hypothetical protein M513_01834 [Trichuris suis]KFD72709.1 hypothetical protein M514_01834 [Trichuris suis]KHJ46372.1 hypothetical protein D918_03425 [Trichuris suis]